MLAARSNNLQNATVEGQIKTKNKPGLKANNQLKNSTNLKKGLSVGNTNTISNKPRPLQLSTNTKHAQQSKIPISLKPIQKSNSEDEPIKKKTQTPKIDKKVLQQTKSDENDVGLYAQESYNALLDIHPMDEELYQKVLKLELADDGLPTFNSDEPFDF